MKLIIYEFSLTDTHIQVWPVTSVKFDEPIPKEYLQFSKEQSS